MAYDTWQVLPGSWVTLSAGRKGMLSLDGTAPVVSGSLEQHNSDVTLDLEIALDQVKANLILQTAARALVKQHGATRLRYHGTGSVGDEATEVSGSARAGAINVDLDLSITRIGMDALISGVAHLGTVELPLPGVGRIDDLAFTVECRVTLTQT